MTGYLLGELPEMESVAFEARYFGEPEFFQQVIAAENDLIDDYVNDRLSAESRKRVEAVYLADSVRRERIRFAEALAERIQRSKPAVAVPWWAGLVAAIRDPTPALGFAMAFAGLFIVAGAVWFFYASRSQSPEVAVQQPAANNATSLPENVRTPSRAQPESVIKENLQSQNIPAPAEHSPFPARTPSSERDQPSRPAFLALSLGGVRGGSVSGIPTLALSRGVTQARLRITLKENVYPAYRIALQTVSGTTISSSPTIKPQISRSGASLFLSLPASKLTRGDHIITVTGIDGSGPGEDVGKALFRVERTP